MSKKRLAVIVNGMAAARLLDELFRATGSHETLALPSAGYCRCAGLDVAICFDDSMGPSNIHAYIDFGRVAPARQSEVYRKLLLWNLRLAPKHFLRSVTPIYRYGSNSRGSITIEDEILRLVPHSNIRSVE